MLPPLVVGKPLPEMGTFRADALARAFWRASYRCGRDYLDGLDARGQQVLVRHEREKPDSYARRRRITKPRNHCGPIIRRYNDFVFRRPSEDPEIVAGQYQLILEDADGAGTPLRLLLRHALQRAQIEREVYLAPDSTAPADGVERSQAQAREAGLRPVVRVISPDAVPWLDEQNGIISAILVLYQHDDGSMFARLWTDKWYQDIELKQTDDGKHGYVIRSVGAQVGHPYKMCPIVRLRPLFDQGEDRPGESQIAPMAESQQMIANLLSLLYEEISNVTFSQMVAIGVSADAVKDVIIGNNRLICLPNPGASIEMIGADPAQAKTISEAIDDETVELYRQAGIVQNNPLQVGLPESGIALAFKFNDLAANLAALADAIQDAHNAIMLRICNGNGETYPGDAKYPDDFNMPDYAGEMATLIQTVSASALPGVIKDQAVSQFVSRNLTLTDQEQAELDAQMLRAGQMAETAQSTDPFPKPPAGGQPAT